MEKKSNKNSDLENAIRIAQNFPNKQNLQRDSLKVVSEESKKKRKELQSEIRSEIVMQVRRELKDAKNETEALQACKKIDKINSAWNLLLLLGESEDFKEVQKILIKKAPVDKIQGFEEPDIRNILVNINDISLAKEFAEKFLAKKENKKFRNSIMFSRGLIALNIKNAKNILDETFKIAAKIESALFLFKKFPGLHARDSFSYENEIEEAVWEFSESVEYVSDLNLKKMKLETVKKLKNKILSKAIWKLASQLEESFQSITAMNDIERDIFLSSWREKVPGKRSSYEETSPRDFIISFSRFLEKYGIPQNESLWRIIKVFKSANTADDWSVLTKNKKRHEKPGISRDYTSQKWFDKFNDVFRSFNFDKIFEVAEIFEFDFKKKLQELRKQNREMAFDNLIDFVFSFFHMQNIDQKFLSNVVEFCKEHPRAFLFENEATRPLDPIKDRSTILLVEEILKKNPQLTIDSAFSEIKTRQWNSFRNSPDIFHENKNGIEVPKRKKLRMVFLCANWNDFGHRGEYFYKNIFRNLQGKDETFNEEYFSNHAQQIKPDSEDLGELMILNTENFSDVDKIAKKVQQIKDTVKDDEHMVFYFVAHGNINYGWGIETKNGEQLGTMSNLGKYLQSKNCTTINSHCHGGIYVKTSQISFPSGEGSPAPKNWSESSFRHVSMIDYFEALRFQGKEAFELEDREVFNPILKKNEIKTLQKGDLTGDGIVSIEELFYWYDLNTNKNDPKAWNQDGLEITQQKYSQENEKTENS